MPGRSFAGRLIRLALCVALIGGCTRTRVDIVAKYHPGAPARVERTPDVGVYKIKYATADRDAELRTLKGSKRFLGKGQPLGFAAGAGGEVVAVAGEERFPTALPADTRFCVWYTKSEEPTEFALGARATGEAVGKAAVVAGLVGGVIALELLKASLDDDDCRHNLDPDRCRKCRRH